MNTERDYILRTREEIYDSMCRILTDFENSESNITIEDYYQMLCKIQNNWEIITAEIWWGRNVMKHISSQITSIRYLTRRTPSKGVLSPLVLFVTTRHILFNRTRLCDRGIFWWYSLTKNLLQYDTERCTR